MRQPFRLSASLTAVIAVWATGAVCSLSSARQEAMAGIEQELFGSIDRSMSAFAPDLLEPHDLLQKFTPAESSSIFRLSMMGADDNSHFGLPIWGDKARAAGYEIPLPFGAGAIYNYIERDIEVDDLRIGINGASLRSVSDFVDLGSRSHVNVALGRFDVFIFPFLDVYALLGYVRNESTTRGTVTIPTPGPGPGSLTFPLHAETQLGGMVGGFGVTLAAGYKQIFAALDTNWSQTDIGFDDEFRATVTSARVGWNGKINNMPVRLWTGGAYWDTAATASSTVQVPGVGAVSFEADQGPDSPWNVIFGGQATFNSNIDLFVEFGSNFDDVKIFALGLTFRF